MVIISEPFTVCVIYRFKSAKCVNNVNYNTNCVTLSKWIGLTLAKVIRMKIDPNERNERNRKIKNPYPH